MAMVRRHWKLFLFNLLLGLAAIGVLSWQVLQQPHPSKASDPPVQSIDPVTYARVQQLRQALALTNVDLAAMGCTRQQAEEVLTAIKGWVQTNAGDLAQSEAAVAAAETAGREALQKVGRGDGGVTASQLAQLRSASATALEAQRTLQGGLATAVTSLLSPQQRAVWQAARANLGLPSRYRYVPGLSAQEAKSLQLVVARHGISSSVTATAEQAAITGAKATAMAAANASLQSAVDSVLEADSTVLPQRSSN